MISCYFPEHFQFSFTDFTKTPFLSKGRREFLADYALPVAVIVFSLVGTILFSNVDVKTFPYTDPCAEPGPVFKPVDFGSLSVGAVFGAMGLGFSLSLLFFMDQNISAAMVNSPDNNLLKGNAYHWDLLVIGIINAFLREALQQKILAWVMLLLT